MKKLLRHSSGVSFMYDMCHRRLHGSLVGERLFTVISLADLLYEAISGARGAKISHHMEFYDANA